MRAGYCENVDDRCIFAGDNNLQRYTFKSNKTTLNAKWAFYRRIIKRVGVFGAISLFNFICFFFSSYLWT